MGHCLIVPAPQPSLRISYQLSMALLSAARTDLLAARYRPTIAFCPVVRPSDSSFAGCQVCAYHLDFWLSTSNASKVYLLMGIVCLLALVGGVSLYAVSSGVC